MQCNLSLFCYLPPGVLGDGVFTKVTLPSIKFSCFDSVFICTFKPWTVVWIIAILHSNAWTWFVLQTYLTDTSYLCSFIRCDFVFYMCILSSSPQLCRLDVVPVLKHLLLYFWVKLLPREVQMQISQIKILHFKLTYHLMWLACSSLTFCWIFFKKRASFIRLSCKPVLPQDMADVEGGGAQK